MKPFIFVIFQGGGGGSGPHVPHIDPHLILGLSWNVSDSVTYYLQGCIWWLTMVRKSYWTSRKEDFNFKDRYVDPKSIDKKQTKKTVASPHGGGIMIVSRVFVIS